MLYQEHGRGGRIVEENFDSYQMMVMEDFPKIEQGLVPSGGFWAVSASRPSAWRAGGAERHLRRHRQAEPGCR